MLFPKKVKFRKWQTGRRNPKRDKVAVRGSQLSFGSYGLKATSPARVTSNQIEAARKTIAHSLKRAGKLWIRIFPDRPFTKKPAEVKLGKGKGEPQGYVAQVWAGRILFELDGIDEATAKEGLRKASAKLPVKTRIVTRD
ncbi:MAG: 50S ribosomal protein L16 [Candidatus Vogelbacteria bacterium CG10_big_fil_rev_8_21_14_0_10_51_16]|uniref:Large ribosomal subunit protein uL16 n=1 Tax=Candidatus Vogelbacteria bacterium CG10_big_fil_rev_8_21_14_0_10_51_16 TaxID=1975045 RepID=A0A2H0RDT6_9BACT|nr:MAG: 50S ribosomal protein L16 [Candidatus Vogelbacteria bacterium CG10_big_fil_rev_8_21_14_0_10_51_16]